MPCKNFEGRLTLFAGGELDPSEQLWVGDHLRVCPTCRDEAAGYAGARQALRAYGRNLRAEPAPDLLDGVMSDGVKTIDASTLRKL